MKRLEEIVGQSRLVLRGLQNPPRRCWPPSCGRTQTSCRWRKDRRSDGEGKAEVEKGHAVDRPLTTQRLRPRRPRCRDAGRGREPRLDWARDTNTARHGKTLPLYRLAFDTLSPICSR